MRPLGEILRSRTLLSDSDLTKLLSLQKQSQSRLGDVIISEGMMGYQPLYAALAEQNNHHFVDLLREPPDAELLNSSDIKNYLQHRAIPWQRDERGIIIATAKLDASTHQWIRNHYGTDARIVITSPLDIRRSIENMFGSQMEEECRLNLWRQNPSKSAHYRLSAHLKNLWAFAAFFIILCSLWQPFILLIALIGICNLAYFSTMVFKTYIFIRGAKKQTDENWDEKLATLNDADLPIYTILIPMYRESESLPGMLAAMRNMDYPACKLDIKLLLEEDDSQTLGAALALKPSYHFDIIKIPSSTLRTKPKACNYALPFARGELLTVYDADDRPEPLQLKKSVYMFKHAAKNVACVQARLNYYNAGDNLLTKFFCLEYALLFDVILYGLQRMHIPLPLGGTSNHMRLETLRQLGDWDPYNVTEDADLGVRLSAAGYRTLMLDSFTMEEAPAKIPAWIRQRSRWIKGYMQTWLVHMREPKKLYSTLGMKSFMGFQLFVGVSSLTFLSAPVLWAICIAWLALHPASDFPVWLAQLSLLNLAINVLTHWGMGFYCAIRPQTAPRQSIAAIILYPLYLILHSLASYRALWQLVVNPHFWDKTSHGLAKQNNQQNPLTA